MFFVFSWVHLSQSNKQNVRSEARGHSIFLLLVRFGPFGVCQYEEKFDLLRISFIFEMQSNTLRLKSKDYDFVMEIDIIADYAKFTSAQQ